MSDELTNLITKRLKEKAWSQSRLAKHSGFSRPLISQVLTGKMPPSSDFCIKIAKALDESPERLLRLAGHLPPPAEPGAFDQVLEDLMEIARRLPPEDRQDVLDFARFRYQKRRPP